MAQKVEVVLLDDLDGGSATQTVSFALDGTNYEIDLSDKNANKMREALALYLAAARRVGGKRATRQPSAGSTVDAKKVRAWAKETGLEVPSKGRLPADVVEQYTAAH